MKKLITQFLIIICIAQISNRLFAQDSTFIKTINFPASLEEPFCFFGDHVDLAVKNIFITRENKFAVQVQGNILYPPPIQYLFQQSPILIFDRNGNYETIHWGPYNDDYIINGVYQAIFKNNQNGYFAFNAYYPELIELDNNFMFQQPINLYSSDSLQVTIYHVYPEENSFIVIGALNGDTSSPYRYMAKYDINLNLIWEHRLQIIGGYDGPAYYASEKHILFRGQNNCYYFNYCKQVCIISEDGDSLRTLLNTGNYVTENGFVTYQPFDSCIYFSGNFYGSWSLFGNIDILQISDSLIVQDTLYSYLDNNGPAYSRYFLKTRDNKLLLYAMTETSDLMMYDENMNLLWEKDIRSMLPDFSFIADGKFPIIELENGDFLTCLISDQLSTNPKLTLVRIDQNGHAVGNDEETNPTPDISFTSYPNPFNPTINFDIKIKPSKDMLLKVYNIKGQCVKELAVTESKISWTADKLSSGIYFVRLSDKNKVLQTKKITLIK